MSRFISAPCVCYLLARRAKQLRSVLRVLQRSCCWCWPPPRLGQSGFLLNQGCTLRFLLRFVISKFKLPQWCRGRFIQCSLNLNSLSLASTLGEVIRLQRCRGGSASTAHACWALSVKCHLGLHKSFAYRANIMQVSHHLLVLMCPQSVASMQPVSLMGEVRKNEPSLSYQSARFGSSTCNWSFLFSYFLSLLSHLLTSQFIYLFVHTFSKSGKYPTSQYPKDVSFIVICDKGKQ